MCCFICFLEYESFEVISIYGWDSDVHNWNQVDLSSKIDSCMISGQPDFTVTSRWNSSYFIGGFENDLWNMYSESLGIMSGPLYVFSKCLSVYRHHHYHHHCNMPEGIFLWKVIKTENLYSTHFPPFLKVMYWISSHCLVYNGMPPMTGSSLLLEQGFSTMWLVTF